MRPLYVPCLRGKKGEITAIAQLPSNVRDRMLPLLDVPRRGLRAATEHLNLFAETVAQNYPGRSIMLDLHQWRPDARAENNEHVLSYTKARFDELGVSVNPVVGYDRWDDPEYQQAICDLKIGNGQRFCIRLESDAMEDMNDPDFFEDRIGDLLQKMELSPTNCYVMLDFADLSQVAVSDLLAEADFALRFLGQRGFKDLIVVGSSMPPSITTLIRKVKSSGYISRREMLVWKALKQEHSGLIFGDYAIRNPKLVEDVIAPNINGKIRYTIENRHFVVRGHSMQIFPKGAQNHDLAQAIIDSEHYMGPSFSWGDLRIQECSEKTFRGNSTDWIAIDTNHHLHAVMAEIHEYQLQSSLI